MDLSSGAVTLICLFIVTAVVTWFAAEAILFPPNPGEAYECVMTDTQWGGSQCL